MPQNKEKKGLHRVDLLTYALIAFLLVCIIVQALQAQRIASNTLEACRAHYQDAPPYLNVALNFSVNLSGGEYHALTNRS